MERLIFRMLKFADSKIIKLYLKNLIYKKSIFLNFSLQEVTKIQHNIQRLLLK